MCWMKVSRSQENLTGWNVWTKPTQLNLTTKWKVPHFTKEIVGSWVNCIYPAGGKLCWNWEPWKQRHARSKALYRSLLMRNDTRQKPNGWSSSQNSWWCASPISTLLSVPWLLVKGTINNRICIYLKQTNTKTEPTPRSAYASHHAFQIELEVSEPKHAGLSHTHIW